MSGDRVVPRTPAGFGPAGRSLWRAILADLAEVSERSGEPWELDARELAVLEMAARQADTNRQLEDAIGEAGVTVAGVKGQPRLNAMVTELRQGRIALEKLLGALALPGDDGAMTAAQRRAKAAADSRWMRPGSVRGAA